MSTIALPTWFRPRQCTLVQVANQRISASPFGGSEQVVDMLNDRWMMSLELPLRKHADARALSAFLHSLRGMANTVNLWHFAQREPRGTARGSQTLSASVAQGASSLPITGISPATGTYLAGDLVGVGGLLFEVAADVAAVAGAATVTLTNRVRVAQSSAAVVTWDKPTASFRKISDSGVKYLPGFADAVSIEFGEAVV